ncbi:MAG: radical SAM protein [Desulfotignum sp.]
MLQLNDPFVITHPETAFQSDDLSIFLNVRENKEYVKVSYPVKYGIFSRLETRDMILGFNLNHEIQHARSKTRHWLHPSEWLKRTVGNDWIYYSSGGYAGVYEAIGEYYLPNFTYPTNSLLGGRPLEEPEVAKIYQNWPELLAAVPDNLPDMPARIAEWLRQVKRITKADLETKARTLFEICGARTTVLPPDARHSDYNVIPLTIADGCLYKCRFCKVKNKKPFFTRTRDDIQRQIRGLDRLYGKDLINYNALFLGEHDALNAPADLIVYAARESYDRFGFAHSYMTQPRLYLFGSVDSLLDADPHLFESLNALPFDTYINIGLESFDPSTLQLLGKPVTARQVGLAFDKMHSINQACARIEITGNFVMDDRLPPGHTQAVLDLVRYRINHTLSKGSIYLSPLAFARPSREVLYDFYRLKTGSRLPMFLYIIQRL